jgi:hypothetical protein
MKFNLSEKNMISIIFFFNVMCYLAIQFGAKAFFSSTAGSDTGTVERLAEAGDFEGGSYAMTSYIYSIVPDLLRTPIVLITGISFLFFCISRTVNVKEALIISFLCLAPTIMSIGTFQKDMILVWFVLPFAIIISNSAKHNKVLLSLIIIYTAYALFFRIYFGIILFITLGTYLFSIGKTPSRFFILTTLLITFCIIPNEILYQLQIPRDKANIVRILVNGREGARTAFLNPYEITGLLPFLGNYFYSIWKLDLSFLSSLSIKEMYLSLNLFFYIAFMIWGLSSPSKKAKLLGSLIFGHISVLHLFEPDSGSYLRHLSSTLPYVCILMQIKRDANNKHTILSTNKPQQTNEQIYNR